MGCLLKTGATNGDHRTIISGEMKKNRPSNKSNKYKNGPLIGPGMAEIGKKPPKMSLVPIVYLLFSSGSSKNVAEVA